MHGDYGELLKQLSASDYDAWVDTGDFLPNSTRGIAAVERKYQQGYFERYAKSFVAALAGRPFIFVQGNHDFWDVSSQLVAAGHPASAIIKPNLASLVTACGLTWAGFHHVPYMQGEWAGETYGRELRELCERIAELPALPNVLLTHCPPTGPLSEVYDGYHAGNDHLAQWFTYDNPEDATRVRYNLFGHIHERGGRQYTDMGVTFINGATHVMKHELVIDT